MKQLNIATNNAHKITEIRNILPEFKIMGLKDLGILADIEENGHTLEDNALIKAKYLHRLTNEMSIGEDTGLEVKALSGEPGVKSARYAGPKCDANDNQNKLLHQLEGVQDRTARFRTVIAVVNRDGSFQIFEGKVNGQISESKRGTNGFGYDPIFIPDGYDMTFGEMAEDEKNKMSHRARAVEKLMEYFKILDQ